MFYSKNLKKIKSINHCFFSRKGGFSKGFYKSLNCGRGSNDNKKNINKNLSFVSNKMGVTKDKLVLMHQTHSNRVVEIKKNNYKKKNKSRCNYNQNERSITWCCNSRLCANYFV